MLFHPSFFESIDNTVPTDAIRIDNVERALPTKPAGNYKLNNDRKQGKRDNSDVLGVYHERTPLTSAYFSRDNIDNIDYLLRSNVNKEMGYTIDKQSRDNMLDIMRTIFLSYSLHPDMPGKEGMTPELAKQYTLELTRLNEITIRKMLPNVISDLQQHLDYIRDISDPLSNRYLDNPENVNIKGTREYREFEV
jgi:hypothetical protein